MFRLVCFRFDMINNLYPTVFLPCFVLFEGRRFFVLFEFWHLMFYLSFDMIISRWSYFCLCSLTVENWELAKKGGRNPTTGDLIIIAAIFITVKRNPTTGDITILIMVRSNNDESANYTTVNSVMNTEQMTLTCCQDHMLTENIWFVWSETSYSGDERTNIEDRATQPMEAGGWVS